MPQSAWDKIELICRNETRKIPNFIYRAIQNYLEKYNPNGEII